MPVTADQNVLENGHVDVDAEILEGAGHAQAGGVGRGQLGDVLTGELDGTVCQLLQTADGD